MDCDKDKLKQTGKELEDLQKAKETLVQQDPNFQAEEETYTKQQTLQQKKAELAKLQSAMTGADITSIPEELPITGKETFPEQFKRLLKGDMVYVPPEAQPIILKGLLVNQSTDIDPETGEEVTVTTLTGGTDKVTDVERQTSFSNLAKRYTAREIAQDLMNEGNPSIGSIIPEIKAMDWAEKSFTAQYALQQLGADVQDIDLTPEQKTDALEFYNKFFLAAQGRGTTSGQALRAEQVKYGTPEARAKRAFEQGFNKSAREARTKDDKEANDLKDQINDAQFGIKKTEEQIELAATKADHEELMSRVVNDKLQQKQAEIDRLNARIKELEKDPMFKAGDISSAGIESQDVKETLKEYKKAISDLEKSTVDPVAIDYQKKEEELISNVATAITKGDEASNAVKTARFKSEPEQIQAELNVTKAEFNQSKAELELANHRDMGSEISDREMLENRLKRNEEFIKQGKKKLEDIDPNKIKSQQEFINKLEQEIANLKDILSKKEIEQNEYTTSRAFKEELAKINELKAQKAKLNAQINRIPTEDQIKAKQIAEQLSLKEEIARLSSILPTLQVQRDMLKESYAKRNEGAKASLRAIKDLKKKLDGQIKTLTESTDKLLQRKKDLNEELNITLDQLPPKMQEAIQPHLDRLQEIEKIADEGGSLGDSEVVRALVISQAMTDLALMDDVKALDLAMGVAYINLLSGISTQTVNVSSNVLGLALKEVPTLLKAMFNKSGRARLKVAFKAAEIGKISLRSLITGGSAAVNLEKYQAPKGTLALVFADDSKLSPIQRKLKKAINIFTLNGRYMLGALGAIDNIVRKYGTGARLALMSEMILDNKAKFEGDEALLSTASNLLYNSTEVFSRATDRARAELAPYEPNMKADDYNSWVAQRAFEIVERDLTRQFDKYKEGASKEAREHAYLIGEKAAYQQPLEGWIGEIARWTKRMANNVVVIKTKHGDIKPLVFTIPFVDVVANVAQNNFEYSPMFGLGKALMSKKWSVEEGKMVSKESFMDFLDEKGDAKTGILNKLFPYYEQREQLGRAMIGATVMGTLLTAMESAMDDEEPWIQAFGSMSTLSTERKKELREKGITPYTFIINFDKLGLGVGTAAFKFAETPIIAVLAPVADYYESKKYNKNHDEKSMLENMSMAIGSPLYALSQTGFLRGVNDLLQTFSGEAAQGGYADKAILGFTNSMFNTAQSMFAPGGGLLRSLDMFNANKTVNDKYDGWRSKIFGNIPVVDDIAGVRPALNKFGEEVKIHYIKDDTPEEWAKAFGRGVMTVLSKGRFIEFPDKTSPEDEFLVKHGLTISYFPKYNNIKHTLLGATKSEKKQLDKIVKERAESGQFPEWDINLMGRISHDAITSDEYYELVKLAGPKIKSAVQYVMRMEKATNQERQAVLDELITKAKAEAKAELFGLNRYKAFSEHKAVKRAMKKIKKQEERREMLGLDEEEDNAEE